MAKSSPKDTVVLEPETMSVATLTDYSERGWLYFSRKKFDLAVEDFRHVVASEDNNIDSWFGLGLALKGKGESNEALDAFTHVLGLLNKIEDPQRASVLSRLVKGHINQIRTGDWNLEKEVWKAV